MDMMTVDLLGIVGFSFLFLFFFFFPLIKLEEDIFRQ